MLYMFILLLLSHKAEKFFFEKSQVWLIFLLKLLLDSCYLNWNYLNWQYFNVFIVMLEEHECDTCMSMHTI